MLKNSGVILGGVEREISDLEAFHQVGETSFEQVLRDLSGNLSGFGKTQDGQVNARTAAWVIDNALEFRGAVGRVRTQADLNLFFVSFGGGLEGEYPGLFIMRRLVKSNGRVITVEGRDTNSSAVQINETQLPDILWRTQLRYALDSKHSLIGRHRLSHDGIPAKNFPKLLRLPL